MRGNTTSSQNKYSWMLVLPCAILLIYGIALRWPTLDVPGNFASGRLAYSDIVVFYNSENPIPYLERDIEYPVLTGLTIWLTSYMPEGKHGYFIANALLMSLALLGCFAFLAGSGPDVRLAHFALAPGLAFYGVLNWDALGLLGLVAALYYTRRQRIELAGASLALGACAKLFPAFLLPVLWAHVAKQDRERYEGRSVPISWRDFFSPSAGRLLIAFGAVTAALNLPLALLNFKGWSYFIRFQGGRKHNLDSIWHYLPPVPDQAESLIFALVFLGGIGCLSLIVLERDRWEVAALLSLVLFLLATKVYSPQYDLWILPLLAVTACPLWLWSFFVLADFFYYWAIFTFHFVVTGGQSRLDGNTIAFLLGVSAWTREIALAAILIWGVKNLNAFAPRNQNSVLRPIRQTIGGHWPRMSGWKTRDGSVFRRRTGISWRGVHR